MGAGRRGGSVSLSTSGAAGAGFAAGGVFGAASGSG